MTPESILYLAKRMGVIGVDYRGPESRVIKFAHKLLQAGREQEREACIKACEEVEKRKWAIVQAGGELTDVGAIACRNAIKARGET